MAALLQIPSDHIPKQNVCFTSSKLDADYEHIKSVLFRGRSGAGVLRDGAGMQWLTSKCISASPPSVAADDTTPVTAVSPSSSCETHVIPQSHTPKSQHSCLDTRWYGDNSMLISPLPHVKDDGCAMSTGTHTCFIIRHFARSATPPCSCNRLHLLAARQISQAASLYRRQSSYK